ncbi:outer membrane lipoprotein carrier protein LolA [Crenothrix sp.]|uniref:LolA family protein n=1 Tax=Crenothrix sp. TaxID=3100433 RepID=UPI00374D94FB
MPIFLKALLLFILSLSQSYANDELAKITAQLVKTPIAQGQFQQQKRLKILRKPLLSTGTFTYHHSQGVIWKTLTPMPSLLLINETHLLTGQGEQAVPPAFGSVFKALLGGELNRLTESFDITGKDQKNSWQLQLTPKDALLKKVISSITLTGDTELRQLELQEASGNLTQINFTQITHPDQLSQEQQADFERLSP